jgi:hypothetical protein
MKIRQIILTVVTVTLLATSNAWAAKGGNKGNSFLAPEIDTASGTSAIKVLCC